MDVQAMTVLVGVDPGARWAGIVVREGPALIWHTVIDRDAEADGFYLPAVEVAMIGAAAAARDADSTGAGFVIAIEDVVAPCGFRDGKRAFANPADILGLGVTVGYARRAALAITHDASRVVLIAPGGHGRKPLRTYPSELVTASERRHAEANGGWMRPAGDRAVIRHARSAWDVAGAAPMALKVQAALAKTAR